MSWFDYDKSPERSFSKKWIEKFGSPIKEKDIQDMQSESFQRAADLALSSQLVIQDIINSTIDWGIKETGIRDVTISGGVAQNSLAMCSAALVPGLNSITIPPSPGDSGAAIGAANFAKMVDGGASIACKDIFFGKSQLDDARPVFKEMFLLESGPKTMKTNLDNLMDSGEIICCYFGGNEIGPRALCNRSLIWQQTIKNRWLR